MITPAILTAVLAGGASAPPFQVKAQRLYVVLGRETTRINVPVQKLFVIVEE
jgi:hypothetical protein